MSNTCVPNLGTESGGVLHNQSTIQNPDSAAKPQAGIQSCPSPYLVCESKPSLYNNNADHCYANQVANELAERGGADIYVYKLNGLKEMGKLTDQTGRGTAISGGDLNHFTKQNAFDASPLMWKSFQRGQKVVANAYIGYDFGVIKLDNGRTQYSLNNNSETRICRNISTITIKQSDQSSERATKIRIERSQDGQKWFGVAIIDLVDSCDANQVSFVNSVPSRYWRLRPIAFNGIDTNSIWGVIGLELSDYRPTNITDIQDKIFLENRDRSYSTSAIKLKGSYDLLDSPTDQTQWSFMPMDQMTITIPFSQCLQRLQRPIVIGDILELPAEAQYDINMVKVPKYVEVTDVGWSAQSYTPGWVPTALRITTSPLMASQETQDISGSLVQSFDDMGLSKNDDGHAPLYQDFGPTSQTIESESKTNVPMRGTDTSEFREFTKEQLEQANLAGFDISHLNTNPKTVYVEDAMPPSNLPYTEGPTYPLNPANGDYHRLTYIGSASDIPTRLFKFSTAKNRWLYQETDKRTKMNATMPLLKEFLSFPDKAPARTIK